jgi:hypothetical protein
MRGIDSRCDTTESARDGDADRQPVSPEPTANPTIIRPSHRIVMLVPQNRKSPSSVRKNRFDQ